MPVIEFIDERADGLFLFGRDIHLFPREDLVELFARFAEFNAVFFALFAVFALFLLLVVRLFGLRGKVHGVDAVAELLRHRLRVRILHRFRDLLRKFVVRIINGGQKAEALRVLRRDRRKVHRVVADDFMAHFARALVGNEHVHFVDARVLDFESLGFGDLFPFGDDQLARFGVENIVRGNTAGQAVRHVEFFVEFIPADLDHVVTAWIEKEIVQMLAYRIVRRHFAGAQPSVKLDKAVLLALGGILLDGGGDHLVVAENIGDRHVRTEAEGAQKDSRADLPLSVDVHPHDALRILLEFEPCAAVGNDRCFEHFPARLVLFRLVVRAGRTDELRNDDALRAVDDKGAVVGHEREIAHKHFLIDDLVFDFIDKAHFYPKRERIRCVAVPAFLLVIFRLRAEFMAEKVQLEVIGIVGDRRKILEYFADTLFDERLIRVLLDLDEIGDLDRLVDSSELPSLCLAELLNR